METQTASNDLASYGIDIGLIDIHPYFFFLHLGCQAVLPFWNGSWRVSEPRDSQPGQIYHSYEVSASHMANFSSLHPGRQVNDKCEFLFFPVSVFLFTVLKV